MKPIAILGSGPAGLLAAHAIGLTGHPIAIVSKQEKSRIGGAQFLHMAIPELTAEAPDATVTFRVEGTEEMYRHKVYGSLPVPFTSIEGLVDGHVQPAWHMQAAYDRLWQEFGDSLNEDRVTPEWLDENMGNFAAIVSTIPRTAICRSLSGDAPVNHEFYSQKVRIANECMRPSLPENTVLYNGTRDVSWYRTSQLFGHGGTEWGNGLNPILETVEVSKPVRCTCDCYPEVIKVGRFGKWKKGTLIHDAFTSSLKELNERGIIHLGPVVGSAN
jgi:hypothetical protein